MLDVSDNVRKGHKKLKSILYVVVPCYNEQEVLPETSRRLSEKLQTLMQSGKIGRGSKVVFVDDGSRDATPEILEKLCSDSEIFAAITLSHNRGHQNALLCGLMTVRHDADMVISMDADLQDDIGAIDQMVDEYQSGCDIVYGVRVSRGSDTFFKRVTAQSYYKLLRMLGCKIVYNHADYRLLSSRALDALSEYGEPNIFLRGIIPQLGYKSAVVEYERTARYAGVSKYPLKKMLEFATDGITSLSLRPLRFVTLFGIVSMLITFVLTIYTAVSELTDGGGLAWKLVLISVWFLGGSVLLGMGVVGEYVGRAYIELKQRPRYKVERTAGLKKSMGNTEEYR